MAKDKERLDVLLVNRGFAPSREKAKTLIMAGEVFVNGQREDKPGTTFEESKINSLEVRGDTLPYVSRGGLKLEKAVNNFGFSLQDKVCMDIGASTGGFTDCMLQNGARKVYSVDVGHGQLDWKLRSDERVVCMEKTNFRYMVRDDIEDELDFASCDVSFISLTKILLPARRLLKDGGEMVCLIKPQFEAGKEKVGKKGVVRDPKVHEEVVHRIMDFVNIAGFEVLHLDYSPIKGPEGNIEYLIHIRKNPEMNEKVSELTESEGERLLKACEEALNGYSHIEDMEKLISETVGRAHGSLDKA
ncbi:MAG: TlyA family RNA methyltransferase [Butyrivibrio sp.]|nr:TlyA family RNA methyltransferase [Butyrivibrio sp.]